ncbi:helix-turn-helix domain-containing protein [Cohnella cholangitidis]|uniref:Helix-turn-helix domain-containing protein n=1 Tax=Cohnella cholangitidis TaxID=2598458 RepID=A0A7G5BY46_9BACL|nr:helix-turn-helix domain-containing protein [Cohnella cholangitidis]QMV41880.1 helix-turn-helix domain-containing protein [Cohnella cholangitidis]
MPREGRGSIKVWIHFFIPYAILLAGFLTVGLYAYDKTSSLVENHTKETAYAVMEQTKEIMDRRFEELETIAEQVANGTKVQSFQFVDKPFFGTNPIRILELKKDLFDYSLFNHFILDYYVVYPRSEVVISPRSSYSLRQFYDLEFRYDGQSYEEWLDELTNRPSAKTFSPGQPAVYKGKNHSVISYMQSFGKQGRSGMVLMLIDNTQIHSLLRKLDSSNGGFAFVTDDKGQIISRTGTKTDIAWAADLKDGFTPLDIDGNRMLVTKTTSHFNGWTYLSAQPEAYVLEKVQYFKQLILTIILLSLAIGLLAALLFSYRNSRPLWMLLRVLPSQRANAEAAPNRKVWDYVRSSVTNLIHSHDFLSEKMEQQVPLIRSGFYDRLLRGHYLSNKDIAVAMEHSRQAWEGDYFAVGILVIAGYDGTYNEEMLTELDFRKIAIRDVISKAYGRTISTHDLGENQIGLLINGDSESTSTFLEDIRHTLKELHGRLAHSLNVLTYMPVGGCYLQMTEISRSYEEARLLLHRESWSEDRPIIFHDDESSALPAYYYPPDVELRLINLVKSGSLPETEALLEQIRDNNLHQNNLPTAVYKILVNEITGTLLKCCEQSGGDSDRQSEEVEAALLASESGRSPKAAFEQLTAAFLQLCRKQHDRKKSHNKQLKDDLIRHLEEQYMQTDLSLTTLADRFNTSEAYISYFFKEQTGVNFSEYLENVRMTHAKRMLTESDMPVNEISAWVGYYSLNSFSRAFKRANGLSATEFRRNSRSGI